MGVPFDHKPASRTVISALLAMGVLTGCADLPLDLAGMSDPSSSDLITSREAQVARRFCDKAIPGQTMEDQKYAECYHFVLQRRIRAVR